MFDNLDTTHLTGNIAKDVDFIKNSLGIDDAEFFRRAMANIMSEGTARIESLTNEQLDQIEGMFE